MRAEASWALHAEKYDLPGPRRIKAYVTRRTIVDPPDGKKPKDPSE